LSNPRSLLVGRGYDAIADRFAEWQGRVEGDPRGRYLDELGRRLADGARVLELGCGAGIPDARFLAQRFRVVGIDISREQVTRARASVPTADFVHADFTTVALEAESFDAVVAIYSLNHVPRELLPQLFGRVRSWLAPSGLFLASLGAGDTDAWVGQWLGTEMFFSSYPPETNRRLLREAGFALEVDELVPMREPMPEGPADVIFHWVLVRK
jgi:cyclopropane fatty-acyl-phospholipid synthase-like methyltransferase